MARDEISLGIEYLGGTPAPSTDDVGKIVEVALDEYGDPTFTYVTQTASVADQNFADTLAPFLGTNQDLADDLAPLLETPLATQAFADSLVPLQVAGDLAPSLEGRLLRAPQVLTSGTGATINHPTGTRWIRVRGVGGGGGGGGTEAAAGSMGACGGSGTYGEKTFTATASSSTYTVGAAGAGVSGANGSNGASSTFTHGATTVTLPGGNGGISVSGGTSVFSQIGSPGGGAATNADFYVEGQRGGSALRPVAAAAPLVHASGGGSNPLGNGGCGRALASSSLSGDPATGYGGGGSGRLSVAGAAGAGGNGSGGVWIVEEYS